MDGTKARYVRYRSVRSRSAIAIDRVSTPEALVRSLRRQVLEGAIPVGAHLAEVELAEVHGVSRQSMRSALAELVHMGLLQRAPHRGVWVPILSARQLRDLFWVRTMVEREAVRSAMDREADWTAVERAVHAIGALTEASSWADAVEADLGFHRALVATADSPHLIRIHELLMGELSLSLAGNLNDEEPGFMRGEHERLLDAFRLGDQDAAVAMLEAHLQEGLAIGTRLRLVGEEFSEGPSEEEPG